MIPTVGEEFQDYLKISDLQKLNISSVQYRETKRTFFGAFGKALIVLRDKIAAIEDEDKAAEALQKLFDEIENFWKREGSEFSI